MRLCNHVRTEGTYCGSPALRHRELCYFHHRMNQREQRRLKLGGPVGVLGNTGIEWPLLEDRQSVQVAVMEITKAIIDNRIDQRRAGLLLYSCQLALQNLRDIRLTDVKSERIDSLQSGDPISGALEESCDPDEHVHQGVVKASDRCDWRCSACTENCEQAGKELRTSDDCDGECSSCDAEGCDERDEDYAGENEDVEEGNYADDETAAEATRRQQWEIQQVRTAQAIVLDTLGVTSPADQRKALPASAEPVSHPGIPQPSKPVASS